jgi:hypothetical protein
LTVRSIDIDLLTSSYRIIGRIGVTNAGMMGLLSDTTSSFMTVTMVGKAHIHSATKLVDGTALVRVVKSHLLAVCLSRREDVGLQTLSRSRYGRTNKYQVRITSSVYELEGILEWAGRFDFTAIMAEGTCDFFSLYDASIRAILFPTLFIQSPAILFNRTFLDTLVLLNEGI